MLLDSGHATRDELGALIDGELSGADHRRVSEHVDRCPACAVETERVLNIGDRLRRAARTRWVLPAMDGLAGGVVARVRAEASQSWGATIDRGLDDWHWFIVGGGSVAATFVSMVFVTGLLIFGSLPVQNDSLAGLMSSLQTHPGTVLVEVASPNAPVMQVNSGASRVFVMPATMHVSEQELVSEFTNLVVSDRGRIVSLAEMPERERHNAEALLQQIGEMRKAPASFGAPNRLDVLRIRLLTTTEVSARGLRP